MPQTLRAPALLLFVATHLEVCLAARRVELSFEEQQTAHEAAADAAAADEEEEQGAEEFRRLEAASLEGYPTLCDAALVQEACDAFNQDEDGATGVDVDRVMGVMSATRGSAEEAWRAMQQDAPEPAKELSCQEFCEKLVDYLRGHQWTLPPASDTGCYWDDEGVSRCDMDLSPEDYNLMYIPGCARSAFDGTMSCFINFVNASAMHSFRAAFHARRMRRFSASDSKAVTVSASTAEDLAQLCGQPAPSPVPLAPPAPSSWGSGGNEQQAVHMAMMMERALAPGQYPSTLPPPAAAPAGTRSSSRQVSFCPNCGIRIQGAFKFCTQCGFSLESLRQSARQ